MTFAMQLVDAETSTRTCVNPHQARTEGVFEESRPTTRERVARSSREPVAGAGVGREVGSTAPVADKPWTPQGNPCMAHLSGGMSG